MDKSVKKKIIIIVAVVAVVAAAAIVILLSLRKKEGYRIIKIYEVDGVATVMRDGIGDIDAYQNMVLESGDKIVLNSGSMTLKLDEDKYVYVEPNTEFSIIAKGDSKDSKTDIELNYGAITNEIQNPLSEKSSYEINTPNSNMAVRGTIFRVEVYLKAGIRYTKVDVFDGKVATRLIYEDGTLAEKSVDVVAGKEVLIYDNDGKDTNYVGEPGDINYNELPADTIRILIKIAEQGVDIGISVEELNEYLKTAPVISTPTDAAPEGTTETTTEETTETTTEGTTETTTEGTTETTTEGTTESTTEEAATEETTEEQTSFTVTFKCDGAVFATQVVEKGNKVSKPKLRPKESGSWDFDFSSVINSDTIIEWR